MQSQEISSSFGYQSFASHQLRGKRDATTAICQARRVRSSIEHAVHWGKGASRQDALSILFPRAAKILSKTMTSTIPKSRPRRESKSCLTESISGTNAKSTSLHCSDLKTATTLAPDSSTPRRILGSVFASMAPSSIRRKAMKRSSWLPILPSDVLERLVRMYVARATTYELLQLAEASTELARAVAAVTDYTFVLDEQTLPHLSRWAAVYRPHLRTLRVHRRLRRYPRDVVLAPLRTLLSTPCLRHVTIPALGPLLRALIRLPKLVSLGVYVRNREDAIAALTFGGAITTDKYEGRRRDKHNLGSRLRPRLAAVQLECLEIHCVQLDDAKDDPFCFESVCAVDHLTGSEEMVKLLSNTFRSVTRIALHCHHRLSCDVGPLLLALPRLNQVELDAPVDMTESTVKILRKVSEVRLSGVREGPRFACKLGKCVMKLRIDDITMTRGMVSALAKCTKLQELEVTLDPGAEYALTQLEVSRMKVLRMRWSCAMADVSSVHSGESAHAHTQFYRPSGRFLYGIISKMGRLESLGLEFGKLDISALSRIMRQIGPRLRLFSTSLEGQQLQVDEQLVEIMSIMAANCPNTMQLKFHEVSKGSDLRYRISIPSYRKQILKGRLKNLKRQTLFLDVRDVEEAVERMCETDDSPCWADWTA